MAAMFEDETSAGILLKKHREQQNIRVYLARKAYGKVLKYLLLELAFHRRSHFI